MSNTFIGKTTNNNYSFIENNTLFNEFNTDIKMNNIFIGKTLYNVNNNNYSFAIIDDEKFFNSFNMNLKRINNNLQDKQGYSYTRVGKIINIKTYSQFYWKSSYKNIEHYKNIIIIFLDNNITLVCNSARSINTEFGKVCMLACESNNYIPFTDDFYLFHEDALKLEYNHINDFILELSFIFYAEIRNNNMYNLINEFFTNSDSIHSFFQFDEFMRDYNFTDYLKNIIKCEINTIFNDINRIETDVLNF